MVQRFNIKITYIYICNVYIISSQKIWLKKKSSLKIAARTKPNINQQQQQKHLVMSCPGKILCKQKFQNAS